MLKARAKGWERKGVKLDHEEMRIGKRAWVDIRGQWQVNELLDTALVRPCPKRDPRNPSCLLIRPCSCFCVTEDTTLHFKDHLSHLPSMFI